MKGNLSEVNQLGTWSKYLIREILGVSVPMSLSGEIEFGLRIELIIASSRPRATMFDKILVYQAIFGPEMGNGCPEKYKTGEKGIWTSPEVR